MTTRFQRLTKEHSSSPSRRTTASFNGATKLMGEENTTRQPTVRVKRSRETTPISIPCNSARTIRDKTGLGERRNADCLTPAMEHRHDQERRNSAHDVTLSGRYARFPMPPSPSQTVPCCLLDRWSRTGPMSHMLWSRHSRAHKLQLNTPYPRLIKMKVMREYIFLQTA